AIESHVDRARVGEDRSSQLAHWKIAGGIVLKGRRRSTKRQPGWLGELQLHRDVGRVGRALSMAWRPLHDLAVADNLQSPEVDPTDCLRDNPNLCRRRERKRLAGTELIHAELEKRTVRDIGPALLQRLQPIARSLQDRGAGVDAREVVDEPI